MSHLLSGKSSRHCEPQLDPRAEDLTTRAFESVKGEANGF